MNSVLEGVRASGFGVHLMPRSRSLWWLAVPALLGLSRLVPAEGAGLAFRLGAATACLLLPGALVARALRLEGLAPALAWSMAALFAAMALMFAVHGSLWLALAVLGAVALAAAPLALRRASLRFSPWSLGVVALGAAIGIALWWIAGYDNDAFFHLARVRKLLAFDSLSLRSVDEFRDGGLHPGYAFPLWHGALALISKLAGVDPAAVVVHEPSVLLPLSCLVSFEAGAILFRSRWAGVAALLAQVALLGFAPGHGGSFDSLALPTTASRMLLVPALLALTFAYVREPSWPLLGSVAAASLAMTLVHPTHAALVATGLVGFLVARALLSGRDVSRIGAALVATLVPAGAVVLWLRPLLDETVSHNPGPAELRRAFAGYGHELDVFGLHSYRLAPELYGRAGAVAVAVLVLLPLAVLARRRLWSAFVLGGMLTTFALGLLTFVFPHFADAVSISQARRIIGFAPRAFALAGAALVLTGLLRQLVLPVALGAGILLQQLYPGDFGGPYHPEHGGPAALAWFGFAAAGAALLVGALVRRRLPHVERDGPLAATAVALFLLPVAIHGLSHWSAPGTVRPGLPSGLVESLRADLPAGAVVFSDPQTAYELGAFVPVYVNANPQTHVADTRANHPASRVRDADHFFHYGGPLSVPRKYGAGWLLVDRTRVRHERFPLPRVYADRRYVLYRLG
jgi:hypothetical protein